MTALGLAAKYLSLVLGLCVALTHSAFAQTSDLVSTGALRVCADPANYPLSGNEKPGFENEIAELVASKLELPLEYTWYPMATGFIRNTLRDNKCDVVMGYAQGHEMVLNTNHWMVSVYTMVVAKDSPLAGVTSISDPLLKPMRLGVIAGSPPATHMARNGLMPKAKGYDLFVDSRYENPIQNMLADLEAGEIDAAFIWGPIAGPLVKDNHPDFKVVPLLEETLPPRMFFRITMGVRQGELVWKRKLNSLIRRNQTEINDILIEAGVPLVNDMGQSLKSSNQ